MALQRENGRIVLTRLRDSRDGKTASIADPEAKKVKSSKEDKK